MASREDDAYWNTRYEECDCPVCTDDYCEYCGAELNDEGYCRSDECEEDNED